MAIEKDPDSLQMFACSDVEALLRLKRAAARKLMDAVGVVRINGRPRVMRADLVRHLEQINALHRSE